MPHKLTEAVGKLLFVENKKALRSIDRFGFINALVLHQFSVATFLYLLASAETTCFVYLVVGVAAFEVEHLAVALECKDMSTDTIEEPTVVTYYHCTSCERFQTFLQCTESVHVNVVRRLIEQQYVSLLLQCHSELQAVSFTTGEHAAQLTLVVA